jgi:peptide/nickel transport system permease protein
MGKYVTRRVLQSFVVVVGVTLIVFIVIHLLPGGPGALLGPHASAVALHAFIVENGYNKPIFVQYFKYLTALVQGNLGWSYHYNESVGSLLAQNLPKTALLVGLSYVVAIIVAVPVGCSRPCAETGQSTMWSLGWSSSATPCRRSGSESC